MVSSWQINYNKSRHAQHHHEAQRLVLLAGSELHSATPDTTWTQSKNPFYAGIAICGASALGIAYFVATRPYPPATQWMYIGFLVFGVCSTAYFVFAALNPPRVRLDSTGITLMGTRSMRPFPAPIVYPWAKFGPFMVRRIDTVFGPRTMIRCTRSNAEAKLGGDFGNPNDLAVILDTYGRVYGSPPTTF